MHEAIAALILFHFQPIRLFDGCAKPSCEVLSRTVLAARVDGYVQLGGDALATYEERTPWVSSQLNLSLSVWPVDCHDVSLHSHVFMCC